MPSKRPSATVQLAALRIDGTTFVTLHTNLQWTLGKRERNNPDWFEAGIEELEPAISSKRTALLNYKKDPCEKTLTALRRARSEAQKIARQCANNYWQNLCQGI